MSTTLKYKVKTEMRSQVQQHVYNYDFTKYMPIGSYRVPADMQDVRHITNDHIRKYEFKR